MKKYLYALCAIAVALGSYFLFTANACICLLPHVKILELFYPIRFHFVEGAGYVSELFNLTITPDCMGAKLFAAAFLILTLGFPANAWKTIRYYCLCVTGTIVLNVVRIAMSMPFTFRSNGQLIHNAISLILYFGALTALYTYMQRRTHHG